MIKHSTKYAAINSRDDSRQYLTSYFSLLIPAVFIYKSSLLIGDFESRTLFPVTSPTILGHVGITHRHTHTYTHTHNYVILICEIVPIFPIIRQLLYLGVF